MKRLTLILLIFFVESRAQVLPVWNVLRPYIASPYDGDTIDGKYAAMPYVDERQWPTGVLKYNALQTIKRSEHWTLKVYARIPPNCYFYITAQVDTSTFGVLYEYRGPVSDNQQAEPIDTILTVDDLYDYKDSFYRFAVIRYWHPRQTYDSLYIDALVLTVHEPTDTIITEHDDTIVITPGDTVLSGVKVNYENTKFTLPRGLRERYFDVLGRKECIECIQVDSLGRKHWILKKP
jgi:hypothetical protein